MVIMMVKAAYSLYRRAASRLPLLMFCDVSALNTIARMPMALQQSMVKIIDIAK